MVLSLQHFALGVPDLKTGEEFYRAFGLNGTEGNDRLSFRCDGRDHDEVVLIETGRPRKFHHISFATDSAGLSKIRTRLEQNGVALSDPPYEGAPDGLWFRDPDGNLVNVHVAPADERTREDEPLINRPGIFNRIGQRGCPTRDIPARPRRLGHMILFSPDVPRQAKFYTEMLGMQISDMIVDGFAAFMRTAGDSDHHVLGLLRSDTPGFHHASFEMSSIDESELAALRVLEGGYKHVWGPGRHGVGSNYFHYFRDPWNGMHEYFFDIDYIAAGGDWEVQEWTKKDGMFLWSADGPPPPDFGQNFEAAE